MKKIYLTFLTLCLSGMLFAQTNIIVNGGFEDATLGSMYTATSTEVTNWLLELAADAAATFMIQGEEGYVYEGEKALMVNAQTLGADSWSIQAVNDPVAVDPSNYYRATVMVKCLVADSAHFSFTIGNASYNERARMGGGTPKMIPFNEWIKLTLVVKPQEDALRIPLHFQELGIFYLDDLQMYESQLARAEIDESGDTLLLDFGYDIDAPSASFDLTKITLKADDDPRAIESIYFDQSYPFRNVLKAKIASRIGEGATVTVSYTKPASNPLTYNDTREPEDKIPSFANEAVDNKSTAVGIRSIKTSREFVYYLNDSRDMLTVEGLQDATMIELYSITGQLIKSFKVSNTRENIELSEFASGVYILSVTYKDNSKSDAKFIK
jgi:hypothetical protein